MARKTMVWFLEWLNKTPDLDPTEILWHNLKITKVANICIEKYKKMPNVKMRKAYSGTSETTQICIMNIYSPSSFSA